jgi:hypothetical protein
MAVIAEKKFWGKSCNTTNIIPVFSSVNVQNIVNLLIVILLTTCSYPVPLPLSVMRWMLLSIGHISVVYTLYRVVAIKLYHLQLGIHWWLSQVVASWSILEKDFARLEWLTLCPLTPDLRFTSLPSEQSPCYCVITSVFKNGVFFTDFGENSSLGRKSWWYFNLCSFNKIKGHKMFGDQGYICGCGRPAFSGFYWIFWSWCFV